MTSSAEVFIQSTATDPSLQAQAAVRQIHEQLQGRLATLVSPADSEEASATAAGTVADQVRSHLTATDSALYAPAAGAADTRLLVRALRAASAALDPLVKALAAAQDAATAATAARGLQAALSVHFATEQAVLLPALATLPGADLTILAENLQTLLDGGQLEQPAVIDVREIPHGQRHPRIFARYAALAAGEAFTLVNNHDPKPLRREFEATHPGAFSWDYLESGPELWQVRIGRTAADA